MVSLVSPRRPTVLAALLVALLAIIGSGFAAERASAAFPPCWKCETAPEAPKPPVPDTEIVKAPPAITTDPKPDYSFRVPNGNPEILQFFACSFVPDAQELWNPDEAFDCPTGPSSMGREIHFPYGDAYGDGQFYVRVMGCAMTWLGGTACDPSPALVSFRIDRTGPTLAFDAGAPAAGARLGTKTFVVAWHGTEAGITDYTCVMDGDAPFPGCGTASQLTWTGEGPHTLTVTAKDALGNVGPPLTRSWVIDTVKPVTKLGAIPSALTNNRRASVAYSATDADPILTASCTLKGPLGTTTPACIPTGWTPAADLADGAYTFSVRHTDRAGNASTAVQTTFTVDSTAPELSAVNWDEATGRFTFTAGPGGTVTCSLDGAAFAACVSPFDGSKLEPGRHDLAIQSVDAAGNRTERQLTIEVAAPPTPTPAPTPTPEPTPTPASGGLPGGGPTPTPSSGGLPGGGPTPTPVGSGPGGGAPNSSNGSGGTSPAGSNGSSTGSAGTSDAGGSPSSSPTATGGSLLSETSSPESIAAAFGLPSTKTCLSKRSFAIRLKVPSGVKVKSAKIVVSGKSRKAQLKKGRWQATVDLRGLRKSRVTVGITVTTSTNKTVKGSRTYGVCGAKRRA